MYVLLLKFVTPSGDRSDWETYNDLQAAKIVLTRHKMMSEQYGAGIFSPKLVQHTLFRADEIST